MTWLEHKLSSLGSINTTALLAIIITGLLALIVTFLTQAEDHSLRGLWRHLLPPDILSHPSSRADIVFWIVKHLLKPLWIFPAALSATSIGSLVHHALDRVLPVHPAAGEANWLLIGLFTGSMILVTDLAYYLYHRAQHSNALLWEFHKVHHSAERMVGTTDGRVHPLDDLLYYLWNGVFVGLFTGLWMFFIADPVVVTILGVNALIWAHILTFGYVKHLPYSLSLGWLDTVIVSPQHHHLHHSVNPAHYNRNYSIGFIIWDRLFGTVCDPKPGEQFVYGLADNEAAQYHSTLRLFTLPLINITNMLCHPTAAHQRQSSPVVISASATSD